MVVSRPRALTVFALFTVLLALLASTLTSAAGATQSFSPLAATVFEGRYGPGAATLPNGRVLLVGGYNGNGQDLDTGELFNPETQVFEKLPAGSSHAMGINRGEMGTALLANGEVLIVGGYNHVLEDIPTAEVFNSSNDTFQALPNMNEARDYPGAARLPNGKVLVVGGYGNGIYLKTAELFNPATKMFEKLSAEMSAGRYSPIVEPLPNGKVLIAGGYEEPAVGDDDLKTAEVFNPATNSFEKLGAEMTENRGEAGSAVLASGKILIVGGYNEKNNSAQRELKSAEFFNSETNSFEKISSELGIQRTGAGVATLPNGNVLVAAGYNATEHWVTSSELFNVGTPVVNATAVTNLSATGAGISVTVSTEAPGSAYFQYGTTSAYGAATPALNVPAAIHASTLFTSLSGLAPSTTYHFRAVIITANGVSYGSDVAFTTAAAPSISPPLIPALLPVLGSFTQSHAKWRESGKGKNPPVGTTFGFTLNESAGVTMIFDRQVSGRKVHGRCVAQNKHSKRARSCVRSVFAGTLVSAGSSGSNHVSFRGKLSYGKKLVPGKYLVTVTATTTSELSSSPQRLIFTVTK